APFADRLADHRSDRLGIGDGRANADRRAAGAPDFHRHPLSARRVEIVHHHFRAAPGERQRVPAPQPAAGTGHDRDAIVQSQGPFVVHPFTRLLSRAFVAPPPDSPSSRIARSRSLSILPVPASGRRAMRTTSSGIHQEATRSLSGASSASSESSAPSLISTTSTGRSPHFG